MQYKLVKNEDGEQNLTVFVKGRKPLVAHSSHPAWKDLVAGVLADDETVIQKFDIAETAGIEFKKLSERISVLNGKLYFDGDEFDNSLADQVVKYVTDGSGDWKPLVNFFENVMQNPNEHSRKNLYEWLTKQQGVTITPSGMFIGYKGVVKNRNGKLVSKTAGKAIADGKRINGQIPNEVGTVVEMPRTEVMHNPRHDCDAGLHVGSYDYARGYGSVLLEVHVNPRDVVSVPDAGWKLRTCRYTVAKVVTAPILKALVKDAKANKPVVKATKPLASTKTAKVKPVTVKKGDRFEDTDKRRAGRVARVVKIRKLANGDRIAVTQSETTGKEVEVTVERLQSRKFRKLAS